MISIAEKQAIKDHMQEYLSAGFPDWFKYDIRWRIPGRKSHCQGVLILDDQFVVTFKAKPGEWQRVIYIEAERAEQVKECCTC